MIYSFAGLELDTGSFELRRRGDGEVIAVEPQVFDVLRLLVEQAARVVTKEELLDSVWGTRFVTESALTSRIKAARRAVGDDGRAQQVIRTVHGRGYRFVATVEREEGGSRSGSAAALMSPVGRSRPETAIQLPQNSFVGRDEELIALHALLARARWITVVGPAGCGKTRLALEAAIADAGVPVVVEMEHASTETVVDAVAQAVGLVADGSADGLAACAIALSTRPHLLVLDNCDRVAGAVAVMVGALMARAPSLTVLATSRAPLGGTDETIYALDPLPVADDARAAAVQLFLDRARSVAPAVQFSDADLGPVARICRRLDGLPLAIELAAARVRHLPVAELAVRLEDGLHLLGRPAAGSRHRTLEAAFHWTWDLLDADERMVLSQLAAMPRTFDLELAEGVTTPGAARVVFALLDRSLLAPAVGASQPARYRLLDSLRRFVLERTDPTVVDAARRAHAEYHDRHARELARHIRTDDSRQLVQEAKRITQEIAAAIDWASAEEPPLAVSLSRSLSIVLEQIGPDPESLASITRAARTPAVRSSASAADLGDIGQALCYGDRDLVDDLAARATEIATDEWSRLAAHHLAGWADAYHDRGSSAMAHLDAAERLAIACDDLWQLAAIRQAKGVALRREGVDLAGALALLETAAQTYGLAGDAMHVNNCRYMMAAVAAASGDRTDEAIAWADECAAYARATDNRVELAHAMLTRARLGSGPDNDAMLLEAIDAFRASGDLHCLPECYLLLAEQRSRSDTIPLLEEALDVAEDANDHSQQATALERLIAASWDSDAHRQAATALGALINLVGEDTARTRCPPAMVDRLPEWRTAIAEGQANGYTRREQTAQA